MSVLDVENRKIDSMLGAECPPLQALVRTSSDLAVLRSRWQVLPAVPALLEARSAGMDHSWAGLDVRTLRVESSVGWWCAGAANPGNEASMLIIAAPPLTSPLRSCLRRVFPAPAASNSAAVVAITEEFFFITGNALTLTCATETKTVGAGGFAFCPRNCTHGFVNDSGDEARFVTLNSPAGHERGIAPVRALLESNAPREKVVEAASAGGWVMHTRTDHRVNAADPPVLPSSTTPAQGPPGTDAMPVRPHRPVGRPVRISPRTLWVGAVRGPLVGSLGRAWAWIWV